MQVILTVSCFRPRIQVRQGSFKPEALLHVLELCVTVGLGGFP